MNTVKTAVLMVGLTVLMVLVGGLWGRNGMILFFGIAMVMNLVSYWFSDKIVLRMYRAKEASPSDAPVLY
jgi:heat shock protein HtpX